MAVNLAHMVVLPWKSYKVDKPKGNINHYNNMHITQNLKNCHGLVFQELHQEVLLGLSYSSISI